MRTLIQVFVIAIGKGSDDMAAGTSSYVGACVGEASGTLSRRAR